jgi:hypothetical protein
MHGKQKKLYKLLALRELFVMVKLKKTIRINACIDCFNIKRPKPLINLIIFIN